MYERPTYEELEQLVRELEKNESERIRAQKELQHSNDLLQAIVKSAPVAIIGLDLDGNVHSVWNPAAEKMLGWNAQEVMGKPLPSVPRDCQEEFRQFREQIRKGMSLDGVDVHRKRRDGTPIEYRIYASPLYDDEGHIYGNIAVLLDIGDHKKNEEHLKQYKNIVSSTSDGIALLSKDYRYVIVNNAYELFSGIDHEKLIGLTVAEYLGEDQFQKYIKPHFDKCLQGDTVTYQEWFDYPVLGRRFVEITYFPYRNMDNQISGVVCNTKDITDRKKIEEEVMRQKKLFETMFNTIPDGVVIANTRREIQLANKGCESIFGYKIRELIGKSTELLYADKEKYLEAGSVVFDMDASRQNDNYIMNYRKKDGKKFSGETFGAKLFDENKKWIGNVGIVRDITGRLQNEAERAKLRNQLIQFQKMESIGTLAGGIAHDFNNILSSIIGFTELALDEVQKGTLLEDSLQEVYSAGKRARDLVKQILAFARQSDEKKSPVQPGIIAKEVLKFIRSTIPTNIEIRQEIKCDSLIMANATQIHQALMNLCTNAAHAMEDSGGVLEMILRDVVIDKEDSLIGMKPGDYVELRVSDTGVGIAPEIIGSIFDPYFTTKGPGEGTGMGLATVHGIVESYGGKITVNSQLGKGTTFIIYLPVTLKRVSLRAYAPEKLPSGTERILFVDDEFPIAKMGGQILERLGYSVTTRTSSIEALELFQAKPRAFDLVITDTTMPNMSGDEFAVELMKIRRDIPIILCTGYSKKISDENVSEIGVKALVYKPIVKADLAKTVRKILDEAKTKSRRLLSDS